MRVSDEQTRHLLASYERETRRADRQGERLFRRILALSLFASLGIGGLLLAGALPEEFAPTQSGNRQATFLLEQAPIRPAPQPLAPPPEVEDLTDTPFLAQEESLPAEPVPAPIAPAEEPPPTPRRVYGLRRVYAKGLGAGSGGAVSIVSKHGNTLAKAPDSLVATPEELTGSLVALSTVTTAPELLSRVKPEYTDEMRAGGASGLVKARLLVDVDGAVKAIEIIEDIGFGSREAAEIAFRKLRFKPARRGIQPVAVWITMKYRFVLQG